MREPMEEKSVRKVLQLICFHRLREKNNQVKKSRIKEMSFSYREEVEDTHPMTTHTHTSIFSLFNYNFFKRRHTLKSPERLGCGERRNSG